MEDFDTADDAPRLAEMARQPRVFVNSDKKLGDARGAFPDFTGGLSVEDYLDQIRGIASNLPVSEDEGDLSGMVDEHNEWAETRRRANTHLLEDAE